jgi:hypothetical protein
MKVRLLLTALLVTGGLVFVVPGRAHACTCGPPPPFDEAVKEAEAVFVGAVTSVEPTSEANLVYNFEVDEVVAGDVGPSIGVNAYWSGSSCGIKLRERLRYIVFTYEGRGGLRTNMCTRTDRVALTDAFGGKAPDEGQGLALVGVVAIVGAGAVLVLVRTRALARLVRQELE